MTDNTMKYLAIFLATITIVNSAAIIHKNYEDVPAEKISILGPSGSITQLKNVASTKTNIVGPSGFIKHEQYSKSTADDNSAKLSSEVTHIESPSGSTVAKNGVVSTHQHTADCVHDKQEYKQETNTAFAHHGSQTFVKNERDQITSVSGQSESGSQVDFESLLNGYLAAIYKTVDNNPVTAKPSVQYIQPSVEDVIITQGNTVVSSPSKKTNVFGPSGKITHETYYQLQNVVKNNFVTGKPVVENVAVAQQNQVVGTPLEKTSVVGPSGTITQEKYHHSIPNDSFKVYNFVKINPVTGKPEVVHHAVPVVENVAVAQDNQVVGTPSEKTSVVGPSGTITQEKYYQSIPNDSFKVYNFVKTNPVTGKPEVVQHVVPVVEKVAVAQDNQVVGTPSEKTSVVGPSGTITQEKYYQSIPNDSFKVYNFVKTNPVTGKPEVVHHAVPVVENVAVAQDNQVVGTPSEKTSVVGPSGTITQEKYYQSIPNDSFKVYNFVKTNPVTGKPEVVHHAVPVVENVAVAQDNQVVGTPSEKTSVVGPSGTITQEKYYQSIPNDSFKVYNFVKTNPVTGKPEVVRHVVPVVEKVAVAQDNQVVGTPSEKTSVVGPSGTITQEKYHHSIPNDSFKVYNFVKINPVTGKPEVVQHTVPVVENVAVAQDNQVVGTPSEKTSVVGPSGTITQEKYYQSIPNDSFKVYNFVKNNPVTGKPEVVQHAVPVVENVAVAQANEIVGTPVEKTSIVGPSGKITQEKYYQYIDGNSAQTHNVVKNIPSTENSFFVQYLHPGVKKIAVSGGTHIVNSPSETTSIVGPSGSIVQQKFSPSNSFVDVKNVSPVNQQFTHPALIQYELVPSKDFVYGTNVNNVPVEKTSIIGPSGSVVQVKNYQSFVNTDGPVKSSSSLVSVQPELSLVYNTDQESYGLSSPSEENDCDETNDSETHHHHFQNSVSTDFKNSVPVYYYGYPLVSNVVNHDVSSNYVVQYVIPNGNNALVYDSVVAPVVETSNSGQSGSITKEIKGDSVYPGTIENLPYGSVKKVVKSSKGKSNIDYPAIQKYPDVAAHDC